MTPEEFEAIVAPLRAELPLVTQAMAALERVAELRRDPR
jgi:hypothetical protein